MSRTKDVLAMRDCEVPERCVDENLNCVLFSVIEENDASLVGVRCNFGLGGDRGRE